jgi:hypothetical protein
MLAAQLGHRHATFGLTQDPDDLSLCVSACLHSNSPRSPCPENSTYTAPHFQGGLPNEEEFSKLAAKQNIAYFPVLMRRLGYDLPKPKDVLKENDATNLALFYLHDFRSPIFTTRRSS